MTLSRKDFFKQGFFSMGEALLKIRGGAQNNENSSNIVAGNDDYEGKLTPADVKKVATAENKHCLAKNCGCFSCMDRCEAGAIRLLPGTGILIDAQLCTGCGTCCYVCPVTPKAVTLSVSQP